MRRRTSISARLALSLALAGFAPPTRAEAPGLFAALTCRPEAAPGRVLCELDFAARGGARLSWVDALVVATPDFVRPLRSRVAAERGAAEGDSKRKLSLAFVATGPGVGSVRVKARAVVCGGPSERHACRPESRELAAELRVGS